MAFSGPALLLLGLLMGERDLRPPNPPPNNPNPPRDPPDPSKEPFKDLSKSSCPRPSPL